MPGARVRPSASISRSPSSRTSPTAADAPVVDRDVGPDRFVAETVDDGGSADDELIHGGFSRRTAVGTDAAASGCDPRVWRMQGSAQDQVR